MDIFNNLDRLDLKLAGGKIVSIMDTMTGLSLKSFHNSLTKPSIPKLYILKDQKNYLYVGVTIQSLTARFRGGFDAVGKHGYHGYKWRHKEMVQLFVWSFVGLSKEQMENIESELVFVIRQETGQWPISQTEIHFNNEYEPGKLIAKELFTVMECDKRYVLSS